jgi:hypothetical protein
LDGNECRNPFTYSIESVKPMRALRKCEHSLSRHISAAYLLHVRERWVAVPYAAVVSIRPGAERGHGMVHVDIHHAGKESDWIHVRVKGQMGTLTLGVCGAAPIYVELTSANVA